MFGKPCGAVFITFLLLFCSIGDRAQATEPCDTVQIDKAYQQILYFYFQQEFFQALTQFAVLTETCPDGLQKVTQPGIDPLLLKGGVSLAFGLESSAAQIFDAVLANHPSAKTQASGWLWLGRTLFQSQQFPAAARALSHISIAQANQHLDRLEKDEWIYLQSQLSGYAQGNTHPTGAEIQRWLNELSQDSVYRHYVRYNHGLSLLQQDQYPAAMQTLAPLAQARDSLLSGFVSSWWTPITTIDESEIAALRDRTNLTMGYAHLKRQRPLLALEAFDRVRIDSLDTDSALLGYGWAAAQREEYQIALAAWQKLQAMPRSNEYILESYLASAYAFELAFAPTQAVDNLQRGLRRFDAESQQLNDILLQVDDDYFIQLASQPHWNDQIPAHLSSVMLSQAFRNQIDGLKQSLGLTQQLTRWQSKLEIFSVLLDERQVESQQRIQRLENSEILNKLSEYTSARDALQDIFTRSFDRPESLADEQEMAWRKRLQNAQQRLQKVIELGQQLDQEPLDDSYITRLERIHGILAFHAVEEYLGRRRQVQKELSSLDQWIEQTAAQQVSLQAHLRQPNDFQQQRDRIAELQRKISLKQQQNAVLQRNQLDQLQGLFAERIQAHLTKLDSYQLQAQLAIVRLNDKAFKKAEADKQGARQ